jgi:uncharacterized membrane protein
MTKYEVFKFLHVVGAIAWVGGGIGLTIFAWRVRAAGDYETMLAMGKRGDDLGKFLFMPAFVLTLGFGIAMVLSESILSFTDLWILIGFGGIVLSGVAEMAFSAPAGKRFAAAAASHGIGSPEAKAAARGSLNGSVLDVTVLLIVVWAMVAKPML